MTSHAAVSFGRHPTCRLKKKFALRNQRSQAVKTNWTLCLAYLVEITAEITINLRVESILPHLHVLLLRPLST